MRQIMCVLGPQSEQYAIDYKTLNETLLTHLQHGLNIVCNFERSLSLRFHFIHSDTFSQLDECKALGEINIKHTLE